MAVLDDWGLPRENREILDTSRLLWRYGHDYGGREVAAAVDWPWLFVFSKAPEAGGNS